MKAVTTDKTRNLLLRAGAGEVLPDALVTILRDEAVACGWLSGSGVLADVELRAFSAELGGLAVVRRVAGPVQVVSLEGSIGLASGDVSLGLRAVLARETDRGLETIAGEIVAARVIALEARVAAFDDIALERALDPRAGVWLLGEPFAVAAAAAAAVPKPAPRPPDPAWSEAMAASAETAAGPPKRPALQAVGQPAAIPPRPARPGMNFDDATPLPEAGDEVEHFAFGRCDVLKSDGDRLHLRVHKDGRIREIALEMLRVTPLPPEGERRRYKLDRRL
jgi:predicted DNA-binding protein with PD1-like motif